MNNNYVIIITATSKAAIKNDAASSSKPVTLPQFTHQENGHRLGRQLSWTELCSHEDCVQICSTHTEWPRLCKLSAGRQREGVLRATRFDWINKLGSQWDASSKNQVRGIKEVTQQSRAAAPAEDPGSVPSTYVVLTIFCNSSSWGSNALFWSPGAQTHMQATRINTKNKSKTSFQKR